MASVTKLHAAPRSTVDTGQVYRISEAAAILRVSESTVYKLMRTGKLRTVKLARATRITGAELASLLAQRDA
jgi:excisionase family DNA binding protein